MSPLIDWFIGHIPFSTLYWVYGCTNRFRPSLCHHSRQRFSSRSGLNMASRLALDRSDSGTSFSLSSSATIFIPVMLCKMNHHGGLGGSSRRVRGFHRSKIIGTTLSPISTRDFALSCSHNVAISAANMCLSHHFSQRGAASSNFAFRIRSSLRPSRGAASVKPNRITSAASPRVI
jgi:hypothetical protein